MNIDSIRNDYKSGRLLESEVDKDPFNQFSLWLGEALESGNPEPTAVTLSTISEHGFPQSRIVLLKYYDKSGFTFFTNYKSAKGTEVQANKKVALNFFWPEMQRQVRITGEARITGPELSDKYFKSRPVSSQIGAWASKQSQVVPSREYLDNQFEIFSRKFRDKEIARPDYWGGYTVEPTRIEFWQGRVSRMHDRILYIRIKDGWNMVRLAP